MIGFQIPIALFFEKLLKKYAGEQFSDLSKFDSRSDLLFVLNGNDILSFFYHILNLKKVNFSKLRESSRVVSFLFLFTEPIIFIGCIIILSLQANKISDLIKSIIVGIMFIFIFIYNSLRFIICPFSLKHKKINEIYNKQHQPSILEAQSSD